MATQYPHFQAGRTAYFHELGRFDNPHVFDTQAWEDWNAGWWSAFDDDVGTPYGGDEEDHGDEEDYDDGQPDEMQEWHDFDPDC